MEKHRVIGSDIVKTGILQAVEHYILAIQMERRCERNEAIPDAVKLLEGVAQILKGEGRIHGDETQESS